MTSWMWIGMAEVRGIASPPPWRRAGRPCMRAPVAIIASDGNGAWDGNGVVGRAAVDPDRDDQCRRDTAQDDRRRAASYDALPPLCAPRVVNGLPDARAPLDGRFRWRPGQPQQMRRHVFFIGHHASMGPELVGGGRSCRPATTANDSRNACRALVRSDSAALYPRPSRRPISSTDLPSRYFHTSASRYRPGR